MNFKMIGRINSQILMAEALFMLPAMGICLWDRDFKQALSFLFVIILIYILAGGVYLLCRKAKHGFFAKDGLACVAIAWIVISLFGCLPFYISGEIPKFIDAFFETVSGFTTTGSSILSNVEGLSRGMLYWRSFTHWLGGMGVLVFLLAIAPLGGRNSGFTLHLLRAESPGPDVAKLVPRMAQTARILYLIYIALTVADFIFLIAGNMPIFDAVCTALGTAGTGGFGIKNDSLAGYTPYIQNVTTAFMLIFGINFSLYYLLLLKQFKNVFKDEELRFYLGIVFASIALITLNTYKLYPTISETIRHSAFQVAAIVSSTGFATTDFDMWPSFSKAILFVLMALGACAGSTGGGFKCGRLIILIKTLKRNIRQIVNPDKVEVIRVSGAPLSEKVIQNTTVYVVAYILIIVVSYLLLSLDGFSSTTNFSAVLSCVNNIGPGFDAVGPTCNFSGYGVLSKLVLIFDMLAGRLELFPMLVLFSSFSKKMRIS